MPASATAWSGRNTTGCFPRGWPLSPKVRCRRFIRRRHRAGVEHLTLSAEQKVASSFQQPERRPGDGREDVRIVDHRSLEASMYLLAHLGTAFRVDQRHVHVLELILAEVEP